MSEHPETELSNGYWHNVPSVLENVLFLSKTTDPITFIFSLQDTVAEELKTFAEHLKPYLFKLLINQIHSLLVGTRKIANIDDCLLLDYGLLKQ